MAIRSVTGPLSGKYSQHSVVCGASALGSSTTPSPKRPLERISQEAIRGKETNVCYTSSGEGMKEERIRGGSQSQSPSTFKLSAKLNGIV